MLSATNQLASDNVSRLTYNPNGTVATATDALRNVSDPAGNLLSMRDARGTTSYAYNALHQTTAVTEPDNANNVTRFAYDANGKRTQTIYPNGVTQFQQYDASERPPDRAFAPLSSARARARSSAAPPPRWPHSAPG